MTNKYILGAILWALFILMLTLTPGKSVPDITLFSYDKIGHAFVFFILSLLLSKGLFDAKGSVLIAVGVTLIASTFYGLGIEIVQDFIPDRGMEWFDALANLIGSFLGVSTFYFGNKLKA